MDIVPNTNTGIIRIVRFTTMPKGDYIFILKLATGRLGFLCRIIFGWNWVNQ
jgi:hypothetical protein